MYKCIHIIHVVDILLLNVQYLLTCMYKEWAQSVVFVLFLDPVEWMHMRECCGIILPLSMRNSIQCGSLFLALKWVVTRSKKERSRQDL